MEISRKEASFIRSLQVKKYRKQEQCFVVEGGKSVLELLASDFEIVSVLGTPEFLASAHTALTGEVHEVSEKTLESLGEFKTNRTALAVARMKPNKALSVEAGEYALVLDDIRDPGNFGTIVRTADWYGIRKLIASPETADFYNPKTISSTMGSFTRVSVFYTTLPSYLNTSGVPIYGAFLDGTDVHTVAFAGGGLIVIGSESHGISPEVASQVGTRITIRRYGKAESLNAAIATAVICDNLRRVSRP